MRSRRITGESSTLESSVPSERVAGVGTRRSCLTEDEILAFCAGEASADKLALFDDHLDQCDACRACVAEMAGRDDGDADDTLHPTIFQPGTMAAERFRIVRFIKRGGMGEVYEAYDQVLEIPVALKTVVSTACDNPRAVRKLKAEVQLARSVRHPNVCSVFDFWEHRSPGEERSPIFFFTMEFIEGETLGQRLRRQRPTLREVMRLARLQLLGLAAAHAIGVVHRDYKSDNVMLRRGRADDTEVVVMDFGLARALHAEGSSTSNDSQHLAGSVAYMAPEQVEGRRHIGTEADIFAFGVVLFEMLTGRLPFTGDSPWTIAARRLSERAPAPSRFHSHVSPALDAFVQRCMSREPADRFRDAGETLAAFDRLLGSAPRPARPRWLALAGAAAALGAAAAVTAWTGSRHGEKAPTSLGTAREALGLSAGGLERHDEHAAPLPAPRAEIEDVAPAAEDDGQTSSIPAEVGASAGEIAAQALRPAPAPAADPGAERSKAASPERSAETGLTPPVRTTPGHGSRRAAPAARSPLGPGPAPVAAALAADRATPPGEASAARKRPRGAPEALRGFE